nr:serine/threonine-protein kinase prpf4B [Ipomoea batatas]
MAGCCFRFPYVSVSGGLVAGPVISRRHKGVEMELLEIIEELFLERWKSAVKGARAELLEGWEAIALGDEDEQDSQEEISFQLAEHEEEEELDRIKEETKEVIEHSSELEDGGNHMPEAVYYRADGGESHSGDKVISVGKSSNQDGFATNDQNSGAGGLGQGTPKSERSNDMFCDDIFGESPAAVHKTGKGDGLIIERSGLHDNWDDAEGYYSYRFGEVLDDRYEIIASHGKGVFSTVVRARDLKAKPGDPEEVAIKMIRNNGTMYKAGMEELVILKKLVGADPEDRRHCVRFLSSFKYRNHLCLVFESLHMNLREVLKKFGRNIGLKLTAVRTYAKQLFISLKHLKNCGVLHSDIKPDNMLVNEGKNVLKLCDFGNAMFAGKNEITPYLFTFFLLQFWACPMTIQLICGQLAVVYADDKLVFDMALFLYRVLLHASAIIIHALSDDLASSALITSPQNHTLKDDLASSAPITSPQNHTLKDDLASSAPITLLQNHTLKDDLASSAPITSPQNHTLKDDLASSAPITLPQNHTLKDDLASSAPITSPQNHTFKG